jgi:hypothetical protein
MSHTPKASWPWVKTLLHSVYDQPDTDTASVHAQFDRLLDGVADTLRHQVPRASPVASGRDWPVRNAAVHRLRRDSLGTVTSSRSSLRRSAGSTSSAVARGHREVVFRSTQPRSSSGGRLMPGTDTP